MDYQTLFSEIHKRPQMYGIDGSYQSFCAFLHGVDAGNDWQLLAGFTELLIPRVGTGNNLRWPMLVLRLAFPEAVGGRPAMAEDPEHRAAAVDLLFSLLNDYLERRSRPSGLVAIFDEYLTWLKQQSWHGTT